VHAVAEPREALGVPKLLIIIIIFFLLKFHMAPKKKQKKKTKILLSYLFKLPLDTSYMNCLVPLLSAWRRTSCLIGLQACV
jgi:hypothetical protein